MSAIKRSLLSRTGTLLYVLLWLFTAQTLHAQDQAAGAKRTWSAGAAFFMSKPTVIDESFSSVPYSAILPGFGASVETQGRKGLHRIAFFYTQGLLKSKTNPVANLRSTYYAFDYSLVYPLLPAYSEFPLVVKAGGSIAMFHADRTFSGFINNNSTYDFAALLGPEVDLCYLFKNGLEGLSLVAQITAPAVGYWEQPSFSGETMPSHSQIASYNSILVLKGCTSLEESIGGNQKISLSYTWDYYRIRGSRPVNQANHRVGLTYQLKF